MQRAFINLQHTATRCNTLQHTATHCNTLQHTATHCNTLQHTATQADEISVAWNTHAGASYYQIEYQLAAVAYEPMTPVSLSSPTPLSSHLFSSISPPFLSSPPLQSVPIFCCRSLSLAVSLCLSPSLNVFLCISPFLALSRRSSYCKPFFQCALQSVAVCCRVLQCVA